jgi:hypothetical protein
MMGGEKSAMGETSIAWRGRHNSLFLQEKSK